MINIGFRKFEGSPTLQHNVEMSLKKKFDFNGVPIFDNDLLNEKIKELKKLNTDIYTWAAIARINLQFNDWMIFYNEKEKQVYVYTYVDKILDNQQEIRDYLDWRGWRNKKAWHNVVFFKNKQIKTLSFDQSKTLMDLIGNKRNILGEQAKKILVFLKLKPNESLEILGIPLSESVEDEKNKEIEICSKLKDKKIIEELLSKISLHPIEKKEISTTYYKRDVRLSTLLKLKYDFQCQVCGEIIEMPYSKKYAESHHIKPLSLGEKIAVIIL